jgi:hypothetical protein
MWGATSLLVLFLLSSFTVSTAVTISNVALRRTAQGNPVLAQDGNLANALSPSGDFVLVGMSYGLCTFDACKNQTLGACGFSSGRILVYTSPNLADGSWSEGLEILPASERPSNAIYFRPHLIYNVATSMWVLWVRWLPYVSPNLSADSTLYLVAASPSLTGPFTVVNRNVTMFWNNSADDNLFVDRETGEGYLVHTARSTHTKIVVEHLAPDYYSSLGATNATERSDPIGEGGMEAPAMWTTGPGEWWVSAAPLCCYCTTGSPTTVFFSSSGPLGPYVDTGSLGNAPGGQQNFVFTHPRLPNDQVLMAFNRWGSDPSRGPNSPIFDYSLQYWGLVNRQGGGWAPLVWQDNVTLTVV